MRLTLTLLITAAAATALTGCKKEESAFPENRTGAASSAPDIAPSAAPNVAFNYAYRFALVANDIAAIQEKHAAACEALGLERCRITGVSYQRVGSDAVRAELTLALAPDLARKFGKDAAAVVEAAHGTLGEVEIGGADQSVAIESSNTAVASAKAERERLEHSLASANTPRAVKTELARQLEQQRAAELAAAREGRDAQRLLATTPMRFDYSTDGYMPGLSIDRTTRDALAFASTLLNGLLAIVVVLLALALPIGLLLLALAHGRRLAIKLWGWLAPRPIVPAD